MAYSRDAFIRDQCKTRERLERYGDMEDGLSQSNKQLERAGESQRDSQKLERELERRYGAIQIWRMAYHSLTRQLEREIERESLREPQRRYGDIRYGAIQTYCTQQTNRWTDRAIPQVAITTEKRDKRETGERQERELDNLMTVYPQLFQYIHNFILQLDNSISTTSSVYPQLCLVYPQPKIVYPQPRSQSLSRYRDRKRNCVLRG